SHLYCTVIYIFCLVFFFSSRRLHTRSKRDWSSDVCSSDLNRAGQPGRVNVSHSQPVAVSGCQREVVTGDVDLHSGQCGQVTVTTHRTQHTLRFGGELFPVDQCERLRGVGQVRVLVHGQQLHGDGAVGKLDRGALVVFVAHGHRQKVCFPLPQTLGQSREQLGQFIVANQHANRCLDGIGDTHGDGGVVVVATHQQVSAVALQQ